MEQKKVPSIRFYMVLLIVLSLSILILSLSYSKESGNTYYENVVTNEDNLKIVYANGKDIKGSTMALRNYMKVSEKSFSVTNQSKDNSYYELDIICDDCYNNGFYYSLDDAEPVLLKDRVILEEDLNGYGQEKDHVTHSLRVFSPDKVINNMSFNVTKIRKGSFEYHINKDTNVISNRSGYAYRNDAVNNYVLNSGILYRVIEIKNDKVICEATQEVPEGVESKFSFNKNSMVVKGNGLVESPYEVNYES